MNPIVAVVDNFFDDPTSLRGFILFRGFKDVTSPIDGVIYPDICVFDDVLRSSYSLMLESVVGFPVKANFMFARMMKTGVKAPHKVHCDANMGEFSAHVYLSETFPFGAGTGFYTHDEHGAREVVVEKFLGEDHHSLDGWNEYLRVMSAFNRLVIHRSEYYHCALPTDGFGDSPENARIVLTCFFDKEKAPPGIPAGPSED